MCPRSGTTMLNTTLIITVLITRRTGLHQACHRLDRLGIIRRRGLWSILRLELGPSSYAFPVPWISLFVTCHSVHVLCRARTSIPHLLALIDHSYVEAKQMK